MTNTDSNSHNVKKENITALFLCIIGIGINIFLARIIAALGLPLYLDTVGSVLLGVVGGYLPGVIVGFVTNVIKSFSDPSSLYYGVLNVLIAFAAAWMSKRGWLKKISGIVGMVTVFVLIGGGLGTVIPWFMDELTFDSESLSGILYQTGYFGFGLSHLCSSILMDIPDKVLTVLLVLIILRFIPEKYYRYFSFKGWMQTPLSDAEASGADRTDSRVMSLKVKFLTVLTIFMVIVSLVAMGISLEIYQRTIIKEHSRIAQGTAEIAAGMLDGDKIDTYLLNGSRASGYEETKESLERILDNSADITYLYVYKVKEDGSHVIFDIDTEETSAENPGTVIPNDQGFADEMPALLAGQEVEPVITNDEFGHLLTAYQPVYDSEGNCVCYVGADVNMDQLDAMKSNFLVEMIAVFLSFYIMLCVFIIWLADYHIIYPINTITKNVDEFTYVGDDQEIMDEDVQRFKSIRVHTGDEVEKLYEALCTMTRNQSEQMRSIRKLSDSTEKMQEGLIYTMATMVENRDSDTGFHIQKTAAYVQIIVEGLEKKGYYSDKITPKFISDVIRSAPLHDVGKINISDQVLNKPGKLTAEEFEVMKTHTTAGKKIIERAIGAVEGESYLMEARNMAAWHHERWDGKGYPDGLRGEEIPLSARIMAVADVFDAVSSPRVYKPAFPLEKALAIIEEGSGTQFDAKCVEVFMDALPEVKEVLRTYTDPEIQPDISTAGEES